ncbi:hypothetical protein LINGRAPRIM_LOCUS1065 [Linum grandiflorum]
MFHLQFLRLVTELSLLHVAPRRVMVTGPPRVPATWSPPRLKVNVDGAVLDP